MAKTLHFTISVSINSLINMYDIICFLLNETKISHNSQISTLIRESIVIEIRIHKVFNDNAYIDINKLRLEFSKY